MGFCLIGGMVVNAQTDVGRFKVPDIDADGVLKSLMTGESAKMFVGKPMEIQKLRIEFYEPDGETVHIEVTSPYCTYDSRSNTAVSDAEIFIMGDNFNIKGVGYVFEAGRSQMEIRSEVKVTFKNLNMKPSQPPQPPTEVNP